MTNKRTAILHCRVRDPANGLADTGKRRHFDLVRNNPPVDGLPEQSEVDFSIVNADIARAVQERVAKQYPKLTWDETPHFHGAFKLIHSRQEVQVSVLDSNHDEYRRQGIPEALMNYVYEEIAKPRGYNLVSSRKAASDSRVMGESRTAAADRMWAYLQSLCQGEPVEAEESQWRYRPPEPDPDPYYTLI